MKRQPSGCRCCIASSLDLGCVFKYPEGLDTLSIDMYTIN